MIKDNKKSGKNFFSEVQDIPDILKPSHLPSLDGLRAVSIVFVIFFHVLMSFKTGFSFYKFANLGVQFFFVISGFLITTLLIKEKIQRDGISLKHFYIRRCFRIIPVAFLYLFVILLLNLVLKLHLNVLLLLASFLFFRNFFRNATGVDHLTTHYWSLSVEEQFYLTFPFILKKSFRGYIFFIVGIISLSLLFDLLGYTLKWGGNIYMRFAMGLITQFQGIAVGSLAAIIIFKTNVSFRGANKTIVNVGLLLVIILLALHQGPFPNLFNVLNCVLFAIILILNLNASDNVIFKTLNGRLIKLVGVLSFSIYIWQQPFTQGLTFINQSKIMKHFDHKWPIDVVITMVLLMGLGVISYVSYFYYERKFLKLRDRFR